jgi:hypothetical protein
VVIGLAAAGAKPRTGASVAVIGARQAAGSSIIEVSPGRTLAVAAVCAEHEPSRCALAALGGGDAHCAVGDDAAAGNTLGTVEEGVVRTLPVAESERSASVDIAVAYATAGSPV